MKLVAVQGKPVDDRRPLSPEPGPHVRRRCGQSGALNAILAADVTARDGFYARKHVALRHEVTHRKTRLLAEPVGSGGLD